MRRYDLGALAVLRHLVTDEDGTPTDTTVAVSVVDPDGDVQSVTPVHVTTGTYDISIPADTYGMWQYKITMSGAIVDIERGKFYVADDDDEELPPLASLDRFAKKLGYMPTGPEADRAADVLDAASTLIRDLAGKTWTDADTGALVSVPRPIVRVCVEAAYRGFGNPEALSQRQIGDSLKGYDRAKREGGEAVYLTDEEKRRVLGAAGAASPSVMTMVSPYDVTPWDEVDAVWASS